MAAEATKAATKQALINGGLQVAGSATQMVGQKFTQKDSQVQDKKQRMFVSYQEKKRRKAQMSKAQKSSKIGFNTKGSYA